MSKKAVVLLSGGLDSTTCLYWAKKQGFKPVALSIRYGQRHVRELAAARAVARKAAVPIHEVTLSLPWLAASSSLVDKSRRLPSLPLGKIGTTGIPSTYVPGRNTMFLSLAVSLADAVGAEAIVIGANALDYSGYPDCRPGFVRAFEALARVATRAGVEGAAYRVHTPLMALDKAGIIRLGVSLGVDYGITHSCYDPAPDGTACGRCDSCALRRKGFLEAGVPDPTRYAAGA